MKFGLFPENPRYKIGDSFDLPYEPCHKEFGDAIVNHFLRLDSSELYVHLDINWHRYIPFLGRFYDTKLRVNISKTKRPYLIRGILIEERFLRKLIDKEI